MAAFGGSPGGGLVMKEFGAIHIQTLRNILVHLQSLKIEVTLAGSLKHSKRSAFIMSLSQRFLFTKKSYASD